MIGLMDSSLNYKLGFLADRKGEGGRVRLSRPIRAQRGYAAEQARATEGFL